MAERFSRVGRNEVCCCATIGKPLYAAIASMLLQSLIPVADFRSIAPVKWIILAAVWWQCNYHRLQKFTLVAARTIQQFQSSDSAVTMIIIKFADVGNTSQNQKNSNFSFSWQYRWSSSPWLVNISTTNNGGLPETDAKILIAIAPPGCRPFRRVRNARQQLPGDDKWVLWRYGTDLSAWINAVANIITVVVSHRAVISPVNIWRRHAWLCGYEVNHLRWLCRMEGADRTTGVCCADRCRLV